MINTQLLITKRTEAGLSQRQLAKHAGVNRETIRRLEHGADPSQLPLGAVSRIAGALQLPLADLLDDQHDDPAAGRPAMTLDSEPLDHNVARLLRRIDRAEDVRGSLSRVERTITLPILLRHGLVRADRHGLHLALDVEDSLRQQDDRILGPPVGGRTPGPRPNESPSLT